MERKWFLKLLGMGGMGSALHAASYYTTTSKNIIKPKRLNAGDTIGLVSPSSRLPRKRQYKEIVKQIQKLGYQVNEGTNARQHYGYLAGSDEQRAADLNEMFADDSVDAIMPFRGGWGANRILHLLDYKLIQENPKILVGFSDITSLLMAIYARTGLITFHGPVGKSDWTDYTQKHFLRVLSGEQPDSFDIPKKEFCEDCDDLYVITPGKANGRLLGGNLSVLTSMIGSEHLPDWKDSILFLEDVGEDIYRIDRMLTQLKISGILQQISGFVFGQCTNCDRSNPYSLTLEQVFDDHIKPLGIPAFSGAMFGHISSMITLPVGMQAQLDAQKGSIQLNESPVV